MRLRMTWLLTAATMLIADCATVQAHPPPAFGFLLPSLPPSLADAQFSADGKIILAQFSSNPFPSQVAPNLYDAATGKKLGTSTTGFGSKVVVHPDGQQILSITPRAGTDLQTTPQRGQLADMVLLDWQTGKEICKFESAVPANAIAAFSPDGKSLYTGTRDDRVVEWDVLTGKQVRTLDSPMKGDGTTAHTPVFFFSADGKRLVASCAAHIRVWDLTSGKYLGPQMADYQRGQQTSPQEASACTPDGRYLCTANRQWNPQARPQFPLRAWDLNSGKLVGAVNLPGWDSSTIAGVSYADEGRVLLAVSKAGWMHAWDAKNANYLRSTQVFQCDSPFGVSVATAKFSADGRLLLTNGDGSTTQRPAMRLWDTVKRQPIWAADTNGTDGQQLQPAPLVQTIPVYPPSIGAIDPSLYFSNPYYRGGQVSPPLGWYGYRPGWPYAYPPNYWPGYRTNPLYNRYPPVSTYPPTYWSPWLDPRNTLWQGPPYGTWPVGTDSSSQYPPGTTVLPGAGKGGSSSSNTPAGTYSMPIPYSPGS